MTEGLKDALLSLINSALDGFDNSVQGAQEVLTGNGVFSVQGVWNMVLTISDALKPFCYIVIGLCLMLEIANVLTKVDVIKWEQGFKLGTKMVLAKVCIDVAPTFLEACYLQANQWISDVLSAGSYQALGGTLKTDVQAAMNQVDGFGAVLGLFVSTMLVALAIKICGLLIHAIAIGRMFELYVYLAVSPLPCAFFPLGDGSGGGMSRITQKFFKSFVAVCLQGVMIMICINIFYMIMGSAFNALVRAGGSGVSELCFTMLLVSVVLVMSVSRCGTWAKGILDAM